MVRANHMINYNQYYHIDDIVLSSFCPNTNKVDKKEKYQIFKDHLHSFHPIQELYEGSFNNYAAYIIYTVLLNSFELNKNILTYEQYFYNVLTGFSEYTGNKSSANTIAKYWTSLVTAYENLLSEVSKPDVKEIRVLQRVHSSTKYINCDQVNNNFYWDIPVQIVTVDGLIRNILILPYKNNLNLFSNFLVINTLRNFYPKGSLSVLQISLDTINIKFGNITVTDSMMRNVTQFVSKFYVDFSTSNLYNCPVCPLSPCSVEQMFKVVQPTTVQRIKKIKLVHE